MILVPDLVDIVKTADSDAERFVARLLQTVDGPADAVAFHSLKLRSHAYKQQAEADFVVLWKGVVVVVEVKGGGVRKHDGVWYSVDRRGDWHRLGGSPMEQARSAMYALRDILQEEGVGWFPHEAIVITPDIDAPPHSVEWKPTHWLAKEAMTAAGLVSALDALVAGSRQPPARQRLARSDDLRTRLFGEFTRMPVMDAHRGAVLEAQNRATEDQARVLASLARNRRMMVLGGAGTGKSLLLVEAAKQEASAARSVLITFGSPALVAFFEARISDRAIDILPFSALGGDKTYDVVLVDEAQDLMTAEGMDRLDRVISGGRAHGRWRMFLDPNNQAHVDGQFDRDVYELVADEAPSFDLDRNVRNTKAIVHVVQEYLGADVGDPGIVHGEKVRWYRSGEAAGVEEASEVALGLAAEGARKSDIWIISTKSQSAPTSTVDGITVTSPRYAKGLEAEHVVVCDLPERFDREGIAALYVAVTRARVSLHIMTSDADRRRMQTLIRQGATLE
ncbi:Nuclease-related domain-containing protein [Geodermatophilus telluris]|uniref:Nuclease-related domain-containing protein n=1 Tax=Geodermatophilus telluris TaxID=1190417 RepID=A0A1G6PE80_9ACTN|nr:NERD domain-containing protein [Geodermatophilus telluris]SDC77856.1 Nuclease-related domain-containing protein [Geodermatophilus telluris]